MIHKIAVTPSQKLWADSAKALGLSRVWLFMGLQDVKRRFRGSFIGPLWLLLNLGFFVGGVGLIYGVLFGQDLRAFLPFLTLGYVCWSLLVSSIVEAGGVFLVAEGYIKQFAYPKQIYILRAAVGIFVNFFVGMIAVLAVQIALGLFNPIGWIIAVPGVAMLTAAMLAHLTIFSYLGVAFRDLQHALSGILLVVFYLTPIVFPATMLEQRGLAFAYLVNPLYHLIEIVRHPIAENSFADAGSYVFTAAYLGVVFAVAALVAYRLDRKVVFLL